MTAAISASVAAGRITYDLRRLRLHGLIARIPKTYRYRITAKGLRTAISYIGLYNRALRTGLAMIAGGNQLRTANRQIHPCRGRCRQPVVRQ